MNWLAIVIGTLAFWLVGALWYGVLFGKAWQRATRLRHAPKGAAIVRIVGLTLLAEFVIVSLVGHMFAFLAPVPHVKMMIATGLGAAVMVPAIAINYLHQRRPLLLFLIDAGHLIVGMAAVGGVFVLLD